MNERNTVQPRWEELLQKAVSEPGIISQAYSRFHGYSLGNQLLAMVQCGARGLPDGPIATYPRWKELGRYVRKGEKAITLCMPVTGKRTAERHNDETGRDETVEVGYTRFVFRHNWFVLAQTDGAEYTPEPIPGWDKVTALAGLSITEIPFEMMNGNVQGYAKKREVAINPLCEQPESTLFHELGHIVLGHTSEGSVNSDSGDRTPRDIRELEAGCVALLCCESLGLPGASESRSYIQHWFTGSQVPERNAQRIFSAADKILKAGKVEVAA